ncbi:hypothetical protein NPS58_29125 [Pseudomonas putida]|nr:hypothetical protein [Pseudomonas putida]MDD2061481.1 hypothetical protein [Pseudomonas putida]
MDDIEVAFEKLLGRQASEKEVQDLYRVKNALNLHNNGRLQELSATRSLN